MNAVRVFTDNMKMKPQCKQCATLFMNSGRKVEDAKCQVRQLKETLEIKLGVPESVWIGGNTAKSSNTCAAAAVRSTAGIVDQTADGLKAMDKKLGSW